MPLLKKAAIIRKKNGTCLNRINKIFMTLLFSYRRMKIIFRSYGQKREREREREKRKEIGKRGKKRLYYDCLEIIIESKIYSFYASIHFMYDIFRIANFTNVTRVKKSESKNV